MFLVVRCQHVSGVCHAHSCLVLNLREASRNYAELSHSTPPFLALRFHKKDLQLTPRLRRVWPILPPLRHILSGVRQKSRPSTSIALTRHNSNWPVQMCKLKSAQWCWRRWKASRMRAITMLRFGSGKQDRRQPKLMPIWRGWWARNTPGWIVRMRSLLKPQGMHRRLRKRGRVSCGVAREALEADPSINQIKQWSNG